MDPGPKINVTDHVVDDVRLARIERLLQDIKDGVAPSLPVRLFRAALTAFASIFGAALLIVIAATILRPFAELDVIGDRIDRILNLIERQDSKDRK